MVDYTGLNFENWVKALKAKYGDDYELRSGHNALLIYVDGEYVAGFSHTTGIGWI